MFLQGESRRVVSGAKDAPSVPAGGPNGLRPAARDGGLLVTGTPTRAAARDPGFGQNFAPAGQGPRDLTKRTHGSVSARAATSARVARCQGLTWAQALHPDLQLGQGPIDRYEPEMR